MSSTMTIGQVARQAGVNVQTLRYYERRRLLLPTTRRATGYRLYDRDAVRRLRFIQNAQELGFTLKEIAQLLALRVDDTAQCRAVKQRAEAKLAEVVKKLKRLSRLKHVLKDLIGSCDAGRSTTECPILLSLEKGDEPKAS